LYEGKGGKILPLGPSFRLYLSARGKRGAKKRDIWRAREKRDRHACPSQWEGKGGGINFFGFLRQRNCWGKEEKYRDTNLTVLKEEDGHTETGKSHRAFVESVLIFLSKERGKRKKR